jgi:hypothetical protein
MNERYPFNLALETTAGVTLPTKVFRRANAEPYDAHRLTLAVELAPEAGQHTIRALLDVGVCRSDQCVTKSGPIAVVVAAK